MQQPFRQTRNIDERFVVVDSTKARLQLHIIRVNRDIDRFWRSCISYSSFTSRRAYVFLHDDNLKNDSSPKKRVEDCE